MLPSACCASTNSASTRAAIHKMHHLLFVLSAGQQCIREHIK
ncbi:hypothetical protein F7725_000536 [Dissostichus mawsoni]|uniref:Uncharacterized protein n=1 Tax=Dissostichus mawsoni TaxID=36200 RepID=A0A7J5ZGM5_DISMA|nr:hypothetical protein F7725_000536 [Dissostichus mawsoni]